MREEEQQLGCVVQVHGLLLDTGCAARNEEVDDKVDVFFEADPQLLTQPCSSRSV